MLKIKVDFEELREVQRRERESQKLTPISNHFWQDVSNYMNERLRKYSELKSKTEGRFIDKVIFQLERELSNAAGIIMEIYTLREKKIIQLAWAEVGSEKEIDTSNLTDEELKIFNQIVKLLSAAREKLLDKVLRGEEVELLDLTNLDLEIKENEILEKAKEIEESIENMEIEDIEEMEENLEFEEKEEEKEEKQEKETDLIKVKILSDVPAFLGTDLKIYGPYKENEIVEIPRKYAKILIEKKKAILLD